MSTNLLDLVSRFRDVNNRESEGGFFRTHVPWVGPEAYLNIIFKPAPRDVLADAANRLNIPIVFTEFLAKQNGAILLSGVLSIYGTHRPGQLLNRSDTFSRLAFNIELENSNCSPDDPARLLTIGGYGFDGSRVCIDRQDLHIGLFQRGEAGLTPTPHRTWKNLDQWIRTETARLCELFDDYGKLLVAESETLPQAEVRKPS
jgi:hypothetical protein